MSNVKRYGNFDASVDCNGKVLQLIVHESIDGKYVLFPDYEAKCADYERLRDALEKYGEHEGWCTSRWSSEDVPKQCNCGLDDAITGLAPAAGSLEEADAPKAARKDKESD